MLQRNEHPMPDFVKQALIENNVLDDYLKRPAYQQNDYLMWINNAKQIATKTNKTKPNG